MKIDAQDHAELIAEALNAKRDGRGWRARCPAHDDDNPSFSIGYSADRVLLHCFAGCDQGRVLAALGALGLWPAPGHNRRRVATSDDSRARAEHIAWAQDIWDKAQYSHRIAAYLRARSIDLEPPSVLRYCGRLYHKPTGQHWPAIVALVSGKDGAFSGIQRTWLSYGEPPRKAPIEPCKMTLGPTRGNAVHLASPGPRLLIGEGIETVLSGMQVTGLPGWASLGATNLRHVVLPEIVRDVTILADADGVGEDSAIRAALRFEREGRSVRIARPSIGSDFNDVLREEHR